MKRQSLRTIIQNQQAAEETLQQTPPPQAAAGESTAMQNSIAALPQNTVLPQPTATPDVTAVSPKPTAIPQSTVLPQPTATPDAATAKPQPARKKAKKEREKVTFYLEQYQANKLYDMIESFRQKTGIRINQQDMLRRIIDLIAPDAVLP